MTDTKKNDSPFLTVSEAAAWLRTTENCLAQWRHRKCGPKFYQPGGPYSMILYRREDVAKWVKSGAAGVEFDTDTDTNTDIDETTQGAETIKPKALDGGDLQTTDTDTDTDEKPNDNGADRGDEGDRGDSDTDTDTDTGVESEASDG